MYALKLPPDVVARLYRLREDHRLGPIRKQALIAIDQYLDAMEAEYGVEPDPCVPASISSSRPEPASGPSVPGRSRV
jgi:hypothetical protein